MVVDDQDLEVTIGGLREDAVDASAQQAVAVSGGDDDARIWPVQAAANEHDPEGKSVRGPEELPYDLPDGQALLTVTNAAGFSAAEPFFVGRASPGIFQFEGSRAVVVNQDFTLNGPDNPEKRGNIIVAYLTGIGPVNPPVVAGAAASFVTLSTAAGEYSATIGNVDATVLFLGLTPGFVGLAQANIEVPQGAPTGSAVPLVISVNRQPGNSPTIAIR